MLSKFRRPPNQPLLRLLPKVAVVFTVLFASLSVSFLSASPAHAASVVGWSNEATIVVSTGSKNPGAHTQFVNYIVVETGGSHCGKVESWTQGFYASTVQCTTAKVWYIDRWVHSGQAVCGAFSDYKWTDPPRSVACIGISV